MESLSQEPTTIYVQKFFGLYVLSTNWVSGVLTGASIFQLELVELQMCPCKACSWVPVCTNMLHVANGVCRTQLEHVASTLLEVRGRQIKLLSSPRSVSSSSKVYYSGQRQGPFRPRSSSQTGPGHSIFSEATLTLQHNCQLKVRVLVELYQQLLRPCANNSSSSLRLCF